MKYITIYEIGINQAHDSNFSIDRPDGLKNWLLLIIKSRACFILNGNETLIDPNTAILFHPNTPQIYHGIKGKENYCDHWMEFAIEEDTINKMGIPTNTPIIGFDYEKIGSLFALLLDEHYFGGKKRELYIDLFTTAIFEKLSEAVYKNKNFQSDFEQLHQRVRQHPDWNWKVEETARELNFSSSHFQHIYRNLFGTSFKNDVIKCRIQRAGKLLSETNYPISKISELCGYRSDNYFVRQFKQMTGMTPLKYRKNT